MTAVGIICEYNPFHYGHMHQIEQAKAISGCDACVCVMSGSFVQRGEVAIADKWQRAEAALKGGADLVIELPVWYVLQSAEAFAYGGVEALVKSRLADAISFGSESADTGLLLSCGNILAEDDINLRNAVLKLMDGGASYPAALQTAMDTLYPKEAEILKNPNDMLGANYIKAIHLLNANLKIYPVKRHMAYHGSDDVSGRFASSTAIRNMIEGGLNTEHLIPYMPDEIYRTENIEKLILGFYRTCTADAVKNIPTLEDGFENKLISAAKEATDLNGFYDGLTSRRYTLSRVKRTVLSGLIGLKKGKICDYIRILGMTEKGARLLKEKKGKTGLPFIVKTADFTPSANSMFKYDISATDIAALCGESIKKSGADYYTSPVIV